MSVITYQFRTVGAEAARRELLAQAAAARELGKAQRASDRVSAPAARRAASGNDPAVKAEQARTKALAAEAKKQAREESKRASEWTRGHEKMLRAREQFANREQRTIEQASKRQHATEHRARVQAQKAQERDMRKRQTLKEQARAESFERLNDTVVGGAMAAVGIGAAATRSYMQNQSRARDLAVGGGQPDQAAALLANAEKTAKSVTGTRTEDVLAGQQRIVAMTGSLDLAKSSGRDMATAARATGASEEDIGSLIATLNTKFGMTDPNEIKTAIANAISQGKSGAFEMKDAASYMSEMGAAGQRFGLDKGGSGFAKLGAMAQVARASTGSGAEAATGVQAMMRQLISKSDDIKRLNGGKDVVFKDKGKTKTNDVVDVIAQTLKASKGNKGKLQEIFGDEGMKGASGFITAFNDAANAMGKNATEAQRMAAGEAAIRKMFDDSVNAGSNWGDVVQDAAARTDSSQAKMTTAWETIVTAVGSRIAPKLDDLASQAGDVGTAFSMVADVVADAVGSVTALVAIIRKITGDTGPKEDRVARLDEIRGEKKDLEETANAGKLGTVGKKRLKQLNAEEGKLVGKIAKEMGLQSATGGALSTPSGPSAGASDVAGQFSQYGFSASGSDITSREQARMAEPAKAGIGDFTMASLTQDALSRAAGTSNGDDSFSKLSDGAGKLTTSADALTTAARKLGSVSGNPLGVIFGSSVL